MQSAPTRDLESPIVIFGCPRSGTSLLTQMLNAHPDVAIFFESYLFRAGSLVHDRFKTECLSKEQFAAFTDFLLRVYNPYGHGREPIFKFLDSPDLREALTHCDGSFRSLVQVLMGHWADLQRKRRWGDKTTILGSREVAFAHLLFPHGKFVHVVRDPRGVANSLMQAAWARNMIESAYLWRYAIESAKKALSTIPPSQVTEVRYEDLCTKPERELKRLCEFLDVGFSAETLKHYLASNAAIANLRVSPIAKNLDKPVLADNHTKWSDDLTGREIGLIESVCRSFMKDYDYARVTRRTSMTLSDHFRRQRHRFSPYRRRRRRANLLAKHLSTAL